jgi:long-chain acyl-CoA synthetase
MWANIRRRKIDEKVASLIRATDAIKIPSLKQSAKNKLFADIHKSFGGRLEFIMIGGSFADSEAIEDMRAFGFNVISTYGLTECTALAAITPIDPVNKNAIGTALPIGELKIIEPDSNGVGEICYRGDNVMLGYYKHDDLNREIKQNGWIRTGDLGAIDKNGYLTVLGRKSNVICSLGRKVYPEELEILLFRSSYVQECAVIGIKNEERATNDIVAVIYPNLAYAKEVLGLYASRPMIKEKISALVTDINARLPQYKQISYFVLLDEEIPKNAYKKIERSTLPEFIAREYLAFED